MDLPTHVKALGHRIADLFDRVLAIAARVTTAEADIVTLDGRLDTAETDITNLESADVTLDSRLDAVETELDDRVMGFASITTDSSSFTGTATSISGLSVTFTAKASTYYTVTVKTELLSTVSADVGQVIIADGADAQLGATGAIYLQSNSFGWPAPVEHVYAPGAGSTTVKVRAQRLGGTGSLVINASATQPSWILVEELGPA
jgi:hypothetical protein